MPSLTNFIIKKKGTIKYDSEVEHLVSKYSWSINSDGYVVGYLKGGPKKKVYLHRLLTNCEKGKVIDHINGNRLDNRSSNLRTCSYSENNYNSKIRDKNQNFCKGVYFIKRPGRIKRWYAEIKVDKKRVCLGYFLYKEEAIEARTLAELKYHGEFARIDI